MASFLQVSSDEWLNLDQVILVTDRPSVMPPSVEVVLHGVAPQAFTGVARTTLLARLHDLAASLDYLAHEARAILAREGRT